MHIFLDFGRRASEPGFPRTFSLLRLGGFSAADRDPQRYLKSNKGLPESQNRQKARDRGRPARRLRPHLAPRPESATAITLDRAKGALVEFARIGRAPPRGGLGELDHVEAGSKTGVVGGARISGRRRVYSARRRPRSVVTTSISAISEMKAFDVFITVLRT